MTRSTELTPKKEGNCNVVATWPRHVISLIIISSDISLSLPIGLTYCFIPNGLFFWYTKFYSSIVGNRLSYIALLRSPLATISFVGQRSLHHHTLLGLISPPPLSSYNYWAVGFKMAIGWSRAFFGSYPQFRTRRVWWPIARFLRYSKYGTVGCRRLHSVLHMDLVGWLIQSLQEKSEVAR